MVYQKGQYLGHYYLSYYVNDIVNVSNIFKFVLFADNTTITFSHKNISVVNLDL